MEMILGDGFQRLTSRLGRAWSNSNLSQLDAIELVRTSSKSDRQRFLDWVIGQDPRTGDLTVRWSQACVALLPATRDECFEVLLDGPDSAKCRLLCALTDARPEVIDQAIVDCVMDLIKRSKLSDDLLYMSLRFIFTFGGLASMPDAVDRLRKRFPEIQRLTTNLQGASGADSTDPVPGEERGREGADNEPEAERGRRSRKAVT